MKWGSSPSLHLFQVALLLFYSFAALYNGCLIYVLNRDLSTMLFLHLLPADNARYILDWSEKVRFANLNRGLWPDTNHLPDLLWAFALGCACLALLGTSGSRALALVFLGAASLCAGFEASQAIFNIGTADWADLFAYLLGLSLSWEVYFGLLIFNQTITFRIFTNSIFSMKNTIKIMGGIFVAVLFTLLAIGSASSVQTVHDPILPASKKSVLTQPITLTLNVPNVKPAAETNQMQTLGGVTVSVEALPYSVERSTKKTERIVPTASRTLDLYETEEKPSCTVTPDRINFKVRIKNGQNRILKLNDVALIFLVDGTQVSIADKQTEWLEGQMLVPGSEREYIVYGPKISQLKEKAVVGFSLFDMPTKYDKAGNVESKENYHWYFIHQMEQVTKTDSVQFDYIEKPMHRESCSTCNGGGKLQETKSCWLCAGSGTTKNKEGKLFKCSNCAATGKVTRSNDCHHCGGAGAFIRRKSELPSPIGYLDGWVVNVTTKPTGASVFAYDPQTQRVASIGRSSCTVRWVSPEKQEVPIEITYQGKTVKVLPYDAKGKPSSSVNVDFSTGKPIVKKGKQVQG